jgi:hypothetical protein
MTDTVDLNTDTIEYKTLGSTTLKLTKGVNTVDFEGAAGADVSLTGIDNLNASGIATVLDIERPAATANLWCDVSNDINIGTAVSGTITIGGPLSTIDIQGAVTADSTNVQAISRPVDTDPAFLWMDGTAPINIGSLATEINVGNSFSTLNIQNIDTTTNTAPNLLYDGAVTQDVVLGENLTSGDLQLGGTAFTTGAVRVQKLHAVDANAPVQLFTNLVDNLNMGTSSTGTITIGQAGTAVAIPSTNTTLGVATLTSANTQTITRPTDPATASLWVDGTGGIDIGTASTGTITVGQAGTTVSIPGTTSIGTATVQDLARPTPANPSTLWVGSGSITIGSAGTTSVSIPSTGTVALSGTQTGINTQGITRPTDPASASLWTDGTGDVLIGTSAESTAIGGSSGTSVTNIPASVVSFSGEQTGTNTQTISLPVNSSPANLWTDATGIVNIGTSSVGLTTIGNAGGSVLLPGSVSTQNLARPTPGNASTLWTGSGQITIGDGTTAQLNLPGVTTVFSGTQSGTNTQTIALPVDINDASLWVDAQGDVDIATTTPGTITVGAAGSTVEIPGTVNLGTSSTQNLARPVDTNPSTLWTGNGSITIGSAGTTTIDFPSTNTVSFAGAQTGINTQTITRPTDPSLSSLWADGTGAILIGDTSTLIEIGQTAGTVRIGAGATAVEVGINSQNVGIGVTGGASTTDLNADTVNFIGEQTGINTQDIARPSGAIASSMWTTGTSDVSIGTASLDLTLGGSAATSTVSIPAETIVFSGLQTGTNTQSIARPTDGATASLFANGIGNIDIGTGGADTITIGDAGLTTLVNIPSTGVVAFGGSQTGINTDAISRPVLANPASLWTTGTGNVSIGTDTNNLNLATNGNNINIGHVAALEINLDAIDVNFSGKQAGVNTQSIALPSDSGDADLWIDASGDVNIASATAGTITIGGPGSTVVINGTIDLDTANIQNITRPDGNVASNIMANGTASVDLATTSNLLTLGGTGVGKTVDIPAATVSFSGAQTGTNTQSIALPTDNAAASLWTDATSTVDIATGTTAAISIGAAGGTINLAGNTGKAVVQTIERPSDTGASNLWADGTGVVNIATASNTTTLGGTGAGTVANIPAETVSFSGAQTGTNTQTVTRPVDTDPATLWTDGNAAITIGSAGGSVSLPGTVSIGTVSAQSLSRPTPGAASTLWVGSGSITIGDTTTTTTTLGGTGGSTTTNIPANTVAFSGAQTGVNAQTISLPTDNATASLWTDATSTVNIATGTTAAISLGTGAGTINLAGNTGKAVVQNIERPDDAGASALWTDGTTGITIGNAGGSVSLPGAVSMGTASVQSLARPTPGSASTLWTGAGDITIGGSTTANTTVGGTGGTTITNIPANTVSFSGTQTGVNTQSITLPTDTSPANLWTDATDAVNIATGTANTITVGAAAATIALAGNTGKAVVQSIERPSDTGTSNLWTDGAGIVNLATTSDTVTLGGTGGTTVSNIPANTVNFSGSQVGTNTQTINRPSNSLSTLWDTGTAGVSIAGASTGTITLGAATSTVAMAGTADVQNITRPTDPSASALWTDGNGAITIGSAGGSVSLPGTVTLGSISTQNLTRPVTTDPSALWAGAGDITIGTGGILTIPNTLRVNGAGAFTGWADATGTVSIFGNASLASLAIANGVTTTNISMGTAQTTGTLQLGNVGNSTVRIQNIGSIDTFNAVSLWDNKTTGGVTMFAGLATGGITIGGNAALTQLDLAPLTTAGTINIGTSQTTGVLTLGGTGAGGVRIQKVSAINTGIGISAWDNATTTSTMFAGMGANNLSIAANLAAGTLRLGSVSGAGGIILQKINAIDPATASSLFTSSTAAVTIGPTGGSTVVNIPANTVAFSGLQTGLNAQSISLPTDTAAANLWTDATDVVNIATGTTAAISIGAAGGTVNIAGNTGKAVVQNIERPNDAGASTLWTDSASDISIGTGSGTVNLSGNTGKVVVQNIERPDDTGASALWTDGNAAITIGSAGGSVSLPGTVTVGSFSSQNLTRPVTTDPSALWAGAGDITIGTGGILTIPNTLRVNGAGAFTGWADATGAAAIFGNASLASLAIANGTNGNISMGTAQTTGTLQLGSILNNTVRIQQIGAISTVNNVSLWDNITAGVLSLGNGLNNLGTLTIGNNSLLATTNIAAATLAGNINIGTAQTTGVLTLGGTGTGAGTVRIQKITSINTGLNGRLWDDGTQTILIGATTGTTTVSIGAAAATVNLAGNTGKAVVQNIERPDDAATSSLWTDGTAAITIGNAGGTVSLPGTVSIGSISLQNIVRPTPGATSVLWVGSGRIDIGDSTTTSVVLPNTVTAHAATAFTGWANVTGASALFENAALTSLTIGGGMASGVLQLGQGTGSTVTVNLQRINAISPAVAAALLTNLTAGGSLTIGSVLTPTTIDATTLTLANTVNVKTPTTAATLFTNSSGAGSVTVGSTATPTTINATTLTLANTINAAAPTTAATFFSNMTAGGSVALGSTATPTTIDATTLTLANTVNAKTPTSAATLFTNTSGAGSLTIGSTATPTTLDATTLTLANTIVAKTVGSPVSLFNNAITGAITMFNNAAVTSLSIANTATAAAISIGASLITTSLQLGGTAFDATNGVLVQKIRAITAGSPVSAWDNAANSVTICDSSTVTTLKIGNTSASSTIQLGNNGVSTPFLQITPGGSFLGGGTGNLTFVAGSSALSLLMHGTENRILYGNAVNNTCFFSTYPGYHLRNYPSTFPTGVEKTGAGATYTTDEVFRGLMLRTLTADTTDTLPTAASVVSALTTVSLAQVGQSFEFQVKNTSTGNFTLTISGNASFLFSSVDNITNAAATAVRIGPGNTKIYKCIVTNTGVPAITAYEITKKVYHSVVAKSGAPAAAGAVASATARFNGPYVSANTLVNTVALNASNNATLDTHTIGMGGVFRSITVTSSSNLSATSGTPDATFVFGISNTAQTTLTQFVTSPASVTFPLATLTTPRFVRVTAAANASNICSFSSFIAGQVTTPAYNALANYPDFFITLVFELD